MVLVGMGIGIPLANPLPPSPRPLLIQG